ncbi:MAG: hypothetical protein GY856_31840 [bacterium]|nr:hypothetical protein [bacterium]
MSASGSGKPLAEDEELAVAQVSVELTAAEVEVLLRIVTRYRPSIPIYLKSSQLEIDLVDRILRKLSEAL